MFEEAGIAYFLHEDATSIIKEDYFQLYNAGYANHFLAIEKENIVSMAGAFLKSDLPFRYFQKTFYGFIGDVYTVPEFRQQSLATHLSKQAFNWLKSQDIAMIRLLSSKRGRSIYEKMGFKQSDEMVYLCK